MEHKKTHYVCGGSCGADLTEEEYNAHATKACGTEGCANKGKPFERKEETMSHGDGEHCEECGGANMCQHCSAAPDGGGEAQG